jgi:TonB family protein
MSFLYLYLMKVALINALMLGFYHFAIRPGRNLKLMRGVLLLTIVLPLLLPLIPQPVIHREQATLPVYVFSVPEITPAVVVSSGEEPGLLQLLRNALYPAIVVVLMLGLLISVMTVFRKLLAAVRRPTPLGEVIIDNKARSPYSFFRWVFFSDESLFHPAAPFLLRHEFSHVKHGHSFDRLLSAMFRALFWFSPFAYLTNRLLSEVHEYQADADATAAMGDKTSYGRLMLTFAGLPGQNQIINPFSAHLKKRIIMLNQLKPARIHVTRIIGGITVILAVIFFTSMVQPSGKKINSPTNNGTEPAAVIVGADESTTATLTEGTDDTISPAEFPGGDDARIRFYMENIRYPKEAREKNIQGVVQYKVFIETDGRVTSPEIISGIGGGCDEEVLRVAAMMPAWKPAMKDGKAVRTSVILPISFKLSDGSGKEENDEVFMVVEVAPQFTGGQDAMVEYLKNNISYPDIARKNKTEGTVYVSFIIEKEGQVSNVKILRGIGSGCDEVAQKAVQDMPPWVPGKQRGKAVRVQYNLPVKFTLGEGDKHSTYSVPEEKKSANNEVFTVVEQPPVFPGGEDTRIAYLVNNINYPAEAKSKGIQGTVYVTFVIEPDGKVSNVKVLRGVHALLDKEAVRVIQSMPAWTPGKQRGEPVRVQFNTPVKFSLRKEKNK